MFLSLQEKPTTSNWASPTDSSRTSPPAPMKRRPTCKLQTEFHTRGWDQHKPDTVHRRSQRRSAVRHVHGAVRHQGAAAPDEFRSAPLWGLGQGTRQFRLRSQRRHQQLQAAESAAEAGSSEFPPLALTSVGYGGTAIPICPTLSFPRSNCALCALRMRVFFPPARYDTALSSPN